MKYQVDIEVTVKGAGEPVKPSTWRGFCLVDPSIEVGPSCPSALETLIGNLQHDIVDELSKREGEAAT